MLEQRIDTDLALGRHRRLAGELEGLARRYPLREGFRAQLMLALYRSGRQADALALYAETRSLLVEELGLEPGAELRDLQRRILAQDPGLQVQAGAAANDDSVPGRIKARRGPRKRPLLSALALLSVAAALAAVLAPDRGAGTGRVVADSVAFLDIHTGKLRGDVRLAESDTGYLRTGGGWIWDKKDSGVLLQIDPRTGAFILGAATLFFLWNVYLTSRHGEPATADDPWGYANSLEWATSCPPPRHNFTSIPRIRSERPAFDLHYPHIKSGRPPMAASPGPAAPRGQ